MTNEQRRAWQQELASLRGTLTWDQADRRNMLMQLLGYNVPSHMLYTGLTDAALYHLKEAVLTYIGDCVLSDNSEQQLIDLAHAIERELHDE